MRLLPKHHENAESVASFIPTQKVFASIKKHFAAATYLASQMQKNYYFECSGGLRLRDYLPRLSGMDRAMFDPSD